VVELLNLFPDNYRPCLSIDNLATINRYAMMSVSWRLESLLAGSREAVIIARDVRQKIRKLLGKEITSQ